MPKQIFLSALIFISFFLITNCNKSAPINKVEHSNPAIIYSDTSISNGIVVIAESKKLKKGDTLNMLIGLEKRELVDSLLFVINGRKLFPNNDGWLEHYERYFNTFEEKTIHIQAKFKDVKNKNKVELTRPYNMWVEMELHIINEKGDIVYRNERNKVSLQMSKVSSPLGPILKIKNGTLDKTGTNKWVIIPDPISDTCFLNATFRGCEMKYAYKIIDRE